MTAPEPTPTADEHIDAVARVLLMGFHDMVCPEGADCWVREPHAASYGWFDATGLVGAILTSTDPAVHAALAASLPAEVMLAALGDRLGHDEWRLRFRNGSATRETDDFEDIARWMQRGDVVEARRVLPAQSTPWEVAP